MNTVTWIIRRYTPSKMVFVSVPVYTRKIIIFIKLLQKVLNLKLLIVHVQYITIYYTTRLRGVNDKNYVISLYFTTRYNTNQHK